MKSRILDISDCTESPLLASSKYRHISNRSVTNLYKMRRSLSPKSHALPNLNGLTEAYFKGAEFPALSTPAMNAAETPRTVQPHNISYQARCAERWWSEFCRWFGSQQA